MSAQICALHDPGRLHQLLARPLERTLSRRYSGVCRGRIEDAVAAAFAELCANHTLWAGFAPGDDHGAWRLLYLLAWRQLRGQCRLRSFRAEVGMLELLAANTATVASGPSPEQSASASELDAWVRRLIVEAARCCGGRRPEPLEQALLERIFEERTDVEVAARHGVPREYVGRGRGWLARAIEPGMAA